MRFVAATISTIDHVEKELAAPDFNEMKEAHQFLTEFLRFQELLFQIVLRMMDVEKFLIKSAIDDLLLPSAGYDFHQDKRVEASNHVAAYLNALTSIKDQVPKIDHPNHPSTFRDEFRLAWDEAKTTSIEFRFSNQYRVFAQHQAQAVNSVTTGGGWDKDRLKCEHHVTIHANTEAICTHRNIKKKEKQDFADHFGAQIDIAHLLRHTTSQIATIAERATKTIDCEIDEAIDCLREHLEQFEGQAFQIYSVEGDQTQRQFTVFSDFVDRVVRFRRLRILKNYECHFVSNRERGHSSERSKGKTRIQSR